MLIINHMTDKWILWNWWLLFTITARFISALHLQYNPRKQTSNMNQMQMSVTISEFVSKYLNSRLAILPRLFSKQVFCDSQIARRRDLKEMQFCVGEY